jgi:hypothetical protein
LIFRKRPRPSLRKADGPTQALDEFWLRSFRQLFEREEAGENPNHLINRWLALDAMTWPDRGPRVTHSVPEDIAQFLDDADIRAKDAVYAASQRRAVKHWLNNR